MDTAHAYVARCILVNWLPYWQGQRGERRAAPHRGDDYGYYQQGAHGFPPAKNISILTVGNSLVNNVKMCKHVFKPEAERQAANAQL